MQLITAAQCRAARALLDWSQPILAEKCGLHVQTISNFEKGAKIPSKRTLETIARTLQAEGIVLLEDDGVQRKANRVMTYSGEDGFKAFMDDVYETAKSMGGEICLFNAKPSNWTKWLDSYWYDKHVARMETILPKFDLKIIVKKGDYNFISNRFAEYRWVAERVWNENSFYAYGDKVAFLNFENDNVEIYVLSQRKFAETMRFLFNLVWDQFTIIPDVPDYKPASK